MFNDIHIAVFKCDNINYVIGRLLSVSLLAHTISIVDNAITTPHFPAGYLQAPIVLFSRTCI